MSTFTTSQEWLKQSQLLLDARPSSTKITTRYSIRGAASKPPKDGEKLPDAKPPRARLILKTYDPVSGACLKYRTSKAAEVSRLVQMLGTLGRRMAALPPRDDGLLSASATEPAAGPATPAPADAPSAALTEGAPLSKAGAPQHGGGTGGGGNKGKKKKGKR